MTTRLDFHRAVLVGLTAATLAACGDNADRDHVVSLSTHLIQYDSCAALERDLEDMLIEEISIQIDGLANPRQCPWCDVAEDGAGGGAPPPSPPSREEGVDYSGTNNQESGVDEADIVKTDGYHVYVLNGRRLHMFGVPTFGALVPESVTDIEGYPTELLIDRDAKRAVVFSAIPPSSLPEGHPLRAKVYLEGRLGWYWRIDAVSKITVLDTTDPTHPTLVREVFLEGSYQTARKVGSSVRLSTYAWLSVPALYNWYEYWERSGHDGNIAKALARAEIQRTDLRDFIPQLYVRTPDGKLVTESLSTGSCQSFYRPSDSHARGVSSIISFDLLGQTLAFDADHVLSNQATFYASTDTLVLAEAAHDWWWYWWWSDDPEHLNVHAFDISQPGQTRYIGSGRVLGGLFDQFSIDEEDGFIRVATTTGRWRRWWSETPAQPENHVFVLEPGSDGLVTVGHLGDIAKGEVITTARFLGDKGYLVTFERVDPLWTLDLSDPRDPRIAGELQVPGFSTYLHPVGEDNLLTIGVGGDENGANWKTQISIFDVGDFAHPRLASTLPLALDGEWGWSEAQWQHKAFTYWAPKKLLAVPQSTYRYVGQTREGWGDYRYISKLELVTVDLETGLSRKGAIDHSPFYNADPRHWWRYVDIRRSIFMGDFVYAISDKAVTVHRTSDLGQVTTQLLPGYVEGDYWWWW